MPSVDRRGFLQATSAGLASIVLHPESQTARGQIPRLAAPVKVAVIGTGSQGRELLAELAKFDEVSIVGVAETDSRRLRRGVSRTKDAKGYADYKKMLSETSPDAVFIATPTHLHKEIALELLNAKVHVYCEAPMAHTLADLKAMVSAARGASTVFQVGHPGRSNPVFGLARKFYRSGSVDKLVSASAQFRQKNSWRTPESDPERNREINWRLFNATSLGLLGEQGSHQLDTLHWFTKLLPVSVSGQGAIRLYNDGREVHDTISCKFLFEDQKQLNYDATLANSFEGSHELLSGTMGTIKLSDRFGWLFKEADAPVQGWEVYASRQKFHNEQGITLIADATKLAAQGKLKDGIGLPHPQTYYAVEAFLKSVTEKAPVVCTADDGLRAAVLAIKGNEAIQSGKEVAITADLFEV